MATGGGPQGSDLTLYDGLRRAPEAHHIFLAIRAIEARFAEAPPLGQSRRPAEDRVWLGQEPSMAFAPATITGFEPPEGEEPGRLAQAFFGLFGPHGPLPAHLTEHARSRERAFRDPTFRAFADMLTHRSMGLLYRAWCTGQPAPSHDRGKDVIGLHVAALAGHRDEALRGRDAMPDLAKRHFAGLLSTGPRNAASLAEMLRALFDAPVRVREFVGSWLTLEPRDRWRLGSAGLGRGTWLGGRVRSRGAKFRVEIGPLTLAQYLRLLPGGPGLARLAAVVRNHAGDALDWDVNLVLVAGEVPGTVLGRDARLGHTSWIGRRRGGDPAADLHLTQGDALPVGGTP